MTKIFIKLLNRGLRSSEYDKFPFQIRDGSSIRNLIDDLMKTHGEVFEVYLEDNKNKTLNYNAIILVNGKMTAAGWKLKIGLSSKGILDTELFDGDTIVFMIAIAGG